MNEILKFEAVDDVNVTVYANKHIINCSSLLALIYIQKIRVKILLKIQFLLLKKIKL